MQTNKMVPVVTHYSFDSAVSVKLCENEEAAQQYLKEVFEEELRIDIEENGWGDITTTEHDETWTLAKISNHFADGIDTTIFTVGTMNI